MSLQSPPPMAVFCLFAGRAAGQWNSQPPPIDPFLRLAERPSDAPIPNGSAWPPTTEPALTGPSLGPPAAGPAPGSTPRPYGPMPPPYGQSPPPYGTSSPPLSLDARPAPLPPLVPEVSPPAAIATDGQSLAPTGSNSAYHLLDHLEVTGVARAYYENDQRIAWSGMEDNFVAEAVIAPRLRQRCGDFEFLIDSEFYINEPYDANQLATDPERKSYAANFQVSTLEISQLALVTNYGDWTFKAGKFVTPFGRFYFPLYTNSRMDAPFIRTEVIDWRETGILAHYKSGYFVGDIAITNERGENLGTNSRKSLMRGWDLESDSWAIGCSAKKSGGVGSENDKEFNNYFGVDMMFRGGPFQISCRMHLRRIRLRPPGLQSVGHHLGQEHLLSRRKFGPTGSSLHGRGLLRESRLCRGPMEHDAELRRLLSALYGHGARSARGASRPGQGGLPVRQAAADLFGPDRGKRRLHCPGERSFGRPAMAVRWADFQY